MPDRDVARIRRDHPRLFFNREMWPAVRDRALGPARSNYDELLRRVQQYPDAPTGSSGGPPTERDEAVGGKIHRMLDAAPATEWGVPAMETAFAYRMTGDPGLLEKTRKMLEASIQVYHQCFRDRRVVNWYSTSRVCALAAYDWICEDLRPEERVSILRPFLQHIADVQPGPNRPHIHGSNDSDHRTGFYGVRNLLWFAGLAAHGDGIDDERAAEFLRLGYRYYSEVLQFRKAIAGDDGGLASATTAYALGAYPWAEFNLYHTWRSALGESIAPHWPHLAYYPIWVLWNWIPAPNRPKEFGSGDTYHDTNDLRTYCLYEHMSQIMHFYGRSHPDCAALAAYIRSIVPEKQFTGSWPIYPFLLTEMENCPPPHCPAKSRVFARHFDGLGQVFMRSGTSPDDTYCLYTIGSRAPNHKHYDENNFILYRNGFLALDTGTRGISKDFNLRHYYSQTVAHNCILIHMPGEPFPPYWGPAYEGPEGQTGYGGMNRTNAGTIVAYETNPAFTYVAGDATPCYSSDKCRLALRQFLFLLPDLFIVCDRVVSTRPEYRKAWLLHTQNEPALHGMQFRADEGGGRLFGQVLLPEDAELGRIGGPGKEFWANGRNWELHDQVKARGEVQERTTGARMLLGNWRVEVAPGAPRTDDIFLHVLQTGDSAIPHMAETELLVTGTRVGVRLQTGRRFTEVCFGKAGPATGYIRLRDGDEWVVDRALTEQVMPQAGLAEP